MNAYAVCKSMITLSRKLLLAIVVLSVSAVCGCSSAPAMRHYSRADSDFSGIRKLAVFPFDALNADEYSGERLRRLVITELLSRGYDVTEPGEVTNVMRAVLAERPRSMLTRDDVKRVAQQLKVDAVITGAAEEYKWVNGLTVSYPEVSLSVNMLDARTGDIMWSAVHTSGGPSFATRHFGVEGKTLSDAARVVVREAVSKIP